jgi:hypothetical protein
VTGCQQGIAAASGTLTATARRLLGRCVALGTSCLDDPATEAGCCAAAAPTCDRNLELIEAAKTAFANGFRRACLGVPFERILGATGLGYQFMTAACDRLEPPVEIDNRRDLGECLARLLVEDVAHELVTTEQPRALDALLCMDVADAVPGAASDDPATCLTEGAPAATPSPTPAPTPSGGGPTATPGGPTPTAAPTPTPSPGPACSAVEVTITSTYTETNILGVQGSLNYPFLVSIPGFLDGEEVKSRVTNLSGASGVFLVTDQDDPANLNDGVIDPDGDPSTPFVNFGVTGSQAIPAGPFVRVRFDCVGGLPSTSQFTCPPLKLSTFLGEDLESPCSVSVSVQP